MQVEPVALSGKYVRLEPLSEAHVPALWRAGQDHSLWALTMPQMTSLEEMRRYVNEALALQRNGDALPFATIAQDTGEVIGSTRFGNITPAHFRVEIGWTWITPARQRTGINTEAKLLMLTHAFETWRCLRVEFKTSARNARSRAALARIGAVEEGVLRQHMLMADGTRRDSVYFSIIDGEWPAVKARLQGYLARCNRIKRPDRTNPRSSAG
jgi:RimJ/RimL family protein N-acetyltransferase